MRYDLIRFALFRCRRYCCCFHGSCLKPCYNRAWILKFSVLLRQKKTFNTFDVHIALNALSTVLLLRRLTSSWNEPFSPSLPSSLSLLLLKKHSRAWSVHTHTHSAAHINSKCVPLLFNSYRLMCCYLCESWFDGFFLPLLLPFLSFFSCSLACLLICTCMYR